MRAGPWRELTLPDVEASRVCHVLPCRRRNGRCCRWSPAVAVPALPRSYLLDEIRDWLKTSWESSMKRQKAWRKSELYPCYRPWLRWPRCLLWANAGLPDFRLRSCSAGRRSRSLRRGGYNSWGSRGWTRQRIERLTGRQDSQSTGWELLQESGKGCSSPGRRCRTVSCNARG